MPKRILWKKGMRLTDDILTLSDKCTIDFINKAMSLGATNRMGLFPNSRKFSLSLDINKDIIEVVSIDCIGLTRNGTLIDVNYDTNYTNSFDTRISIPALNTDIRYLLCITVHDEWRDTNDGLCEPIYNFQIVEENSFIPDNALPIARIVFDEYNWRTDDLDFVPPCLYITSHEKYIEQANKFSQILKMVNDYLPKNFLTGNNDALKIFWPIVQHLMITMDKEQDNMSPMAFLGNIQKFVGSFVCACTVDEYINIGEPQQFYSYIRKPYNFKDAYKVIQEGLELSLSIKEKVEIFKSIAPEPHVVQIQAPTIEKDQLKQIIKYGNAKIKITNNTSGATIFYTIDGSTPTQSSRSGDTIIVESGFSEDWHKEPPKIVTIKVVAYKDGKSSNVETYEAQIRKGNPFDGKQI